MTTENKPRDERVEAAARRIAEICGYPAVTPIDPLWIAHASDVLAAADAAGAHQAAPSGEAVTRSSAVAALNHVEQYNGTGRKAEAMSMLKPAPATAAVPAGWMPIETAPHTGQRILAHAPGVGRVVVSAGWDNDAPDNVRWEAINGITVEPTHWMPLPPPPSQPPSAANEQKGAA